MKKLLEAIYRFLMLRKPRSQEGASDLQELARLGQNLIVMKMSR